MRDDVNTRGGELNLGNPCATCTALTGLIGERSLNKQGDS